MASDEEIARQIRAFEARNPVSSGEQCRAELDEFREAAGEIHDELARRIRRVDDDAVDGEEFSAVIERLDEIEARLDDLEERL